MSLIWKLDNMQRDEAWKHMKADFGEMNLKVMDDRFQIKTVDKQ